MLLEISYENTITILKGLSVLYGFFTPLILCFVAYKFNDVSYSGVVQSPFSVLWTAARSIQTRRGFTYFSILCLILFGEVSEFLLQRLAERNIVYKEVPFTNNVAIANVLQDTYININETLKNPKMRLNELITAANTPTMIDLSQSVTLKNPQIRIAGADVPVVTLNSFEEFKDYTFKHGHFGVKMYAGRMNCSSVLNGGIPLIGKYQDIPPGGNFQVVCDPNLGSIGAISFPRINDRSNDLANFDFEEYYG